MIDAQTQSPLAALMADTFALFTRAPQTVQPPMSKPEARAERFRAERDRSRTPHEQYTYDNVLARGLAAAEARAAQRRAETDEYIRKYDQKWAAIDERRAAGLGYKQPLDVGSVTPAGMAGPGDSAGSPWMQQLLRMMPR